LDVLVSTSSIIKNDEKEESSPPYLEDAMTNLEKKTMNLEDTTSMATPQSTMGSNELNDPLMAPGLAQYV
jgi:hypothetical protein